MRRIPLAVALAVLAAGLAIAPRHLVSNTASNPDFVHFESSHVHPATMTPSGDRLLVVATTDNRLSVFNLVQDSVPVPEAETFVGLEPVSVAVLDDSTAWVVNALSDDISIVNLNTMNVKATLRVGDEPADVVFAGSPTRAYVSVSQEDAVKVYDPADLQAPPTVISMPGSMPRSLARTADGSKVYVALFQSGNHTTILGPQKLPPDSVPEDFDLPTDPGLPTPPHVGLIVQQIAGSWYDMYGNLWNSLVKYSVREADVVEILTASQTTARTFGGVASTVFGLAVNGTDSRIGYVGTEARNLLRFEPRITGYTVETNVGWVNQGTGTVSLRKLNPHIDFDTTPGTQAEADSALGIPTSLSYSSDGSRAYVTAFADARIGVLNPLGGASSTVLARVPCVAGPTQVVVDDARGHLYVVGRFRGELQAMSSEDFHSMKVLPIGFEPSPDAIVNGRKFLYGGFTSSHGEQACASCHIFGDSDHLGWDLGDPNGTFIPPPGGNPNGLLGFHPMKGPLITQSLRGLTGTAPFHWRGDRNNLAAFNNAFLSLMGRAAPLADSEMAALAAFVMPMAYPPNPRENLDRTMPDAPPGEGSALRGQSFFLNTVVDSGMVCADCHSAANYAAGTNRQMIRAVHIGISQDMKVPQLRNLLRKTGFQDSADVVNKRGFGYTHNGSADSLATFDHGPGFEFGPDSATAADNRRDIAAYLLAFDSGLAPSVGSQLTFNGANNSDPGALSTLDTLTGQADLENCDLVAHGKLGVLPRGWWYVSGGSWKSDIATESNISTSALIALADLGSEITVTGVPPGSGQRMGIDRDRDTFYDADEIIAGSGPGNPYSTPLNVGVPVGSVEGVTALGAIGPNPFGARTSVWFSLARSGRVDLVVYDLFGRRVRELAHGQWYSAGRQSLRWDGRDGEGREVGAGVYFVRMKTDVGQWSKPVIRIR